MPDGTLAFTKEGLIIEAEEKTSIFWGGRIRITHPQWIEFRFETHAGKPKLFVDTDNSPHLTGYRRSYLISWKSPRASGFEITPENNDPTEFDNWNPVGIPQQLAIPPGEHLDIDVSLIKSGTNVAALRHALSQRIRTDQADISTRLRTSVGAEMNSLVPSASREAITAFLNSRVNVTYEAGLRGSGKRQGGQQATSLTGLELILGAAERKESNGLWSPTWIDRATFDPTISSTLVQTFDPTTDTGRKNLRTVRKAITPMLSEAAQLAPQIIKNVATYYESVLSDRLLHLAFTTPNISEDIRSAAEDWLAKPKEQRKIHALQLNIRNQVDLVVATAESVERKIVPGIAAIPVGNRWLVVSLLESAGLYAYRPDSLVETFHRGHRSGNKFSKKYTFEVNYSITPTTQEVVREHLSVPDTEGLVTGDFTRSGWGVAEASGDEPNGEGACNTLRQTPDVKKARESASGILVAVPSNFDSLGQAFSMQWSKNIDRLLFTPQEEDTQRNWEMTGSALRTAAVTVAVASALAAPVSFPVSATLGGVAAVTQLGGTMTDLAIAKTTDQGDTARRAWDSFYDNILLDLLGVGSEAFGIAALTRARAARAARQGGAAARLPHREASQILSQWFDPDKIKKISDKRVAASRLSDAAANGNTKVLKIIDSGSGNSWDGIFNLEKAAGQLNETDDLARVPTFRGKSPDDVAWYLKGTGREITNVENLRNAPAGYRIAFLNEDGEIIHAMRTSGNGALEGKNNSGLLPSMPSAWSRHDMANKLTIVDGHFEANGRPVRVVVASDVPEFRIETRRSGMTFAALNAEETALRNNARTEVLNYDSGIPGKTIGNLIENPAGKCEALMNPVASYMRANGYTNIKFRGMGIWDNVDQRTYANHYIVVGERNGQRWAFDLSAGQFGNKGMRGLDGPIIDLEANWAQKYADSTTRKLIKYQDFPTQSEAKHTFGSMTGFDPLEYMPDSTLLSTPNWYNTAKKAALGGGAN
ncbi:hypothetical protein [Streptomyces sp. NPDC058579]|uniref:hypothetical protein n=1 Tax=Streptomyces sp. NPDC058579 TaxID=3346548 RepID=UPI0036685B2D